MCSQSNELMSLTAAACTWCAEAAGAMRPVSSNHAAFGCSPGVFLSFPTHMATMDTLAALGWSRCATGAGAASHVEAPARLVAQHQNPARRSSVLALLSRGYLSCSVASDGKLLETSRGLGTGSPAASRHRAPAARQRGRRKGTRCHGRASAPKALKISV